MLCDHDFNRLSIIIRSSKSFIFPGFFYRTQRRAAKPGIPGFDVLRKIRIHPPGHRRPPLAAAGCVCAALPAARVHVLLALAVSAAVYLAVTFLGGAFSARELDLFRRKKHDPYHRLGV